MKYVWHLVIILGVSFLGELLNTLLPLPVPASIYGLLIMFILLLTKVIKVEHVRETSDFFLVTMPMFFIVAGVGVIEYWDIIKPMLLPSFIIMIVVTIVIMAVTGHLTQFLIKLTEKRRGKDA